MNRHSLTMTLRAATLLSVALLLGGCVSQTVKSTSVPPLQAPVQAIPEDQLLDVAVAIFDPGIDVADEDERIYPEVRRAEARFIPQQLTTVLQNSGAWGAVRVVPDAERISDLVVSGTILHSDGEQLELAITARDARGRVWLARNYQAIASRYAYDRSTRAQYDPFQAAYHQIANDLLAIFQSTPAAERREIRTVAELRFARSFSPHAFDDYLEADKKGEQHIARLPADDDPMLQRVRMLRERDHLFVDTLQEYYRQFSTDMYGPYQEWRKLSYEEVIAYQELRNESRRQLIAGGAAILAGIAAAGGGDSRTTRVAGNVAIIGGGYLLKSGLETRAEAQIHVEALEEVGQSLEAEITPQVIELEDRTVMLSGNVDDQYAQWRDILAELYRSEVGLPEADSAAEPAPGS